MSRNYPGGPGTDTIIGNDVLVNEFTNLEGQSQERGQFDLS